MRAGRIRRIHSHPRTSLAAVRQLLFLICLLVLLFTSLFWFGQDVFAKVTGNAFTPVGHALADSINDFLTEAVRLAREMESTTDSLEHHD